MGGPGSGRKPKKASPEELIEEATARASEAAALAPKKRDYKRERELAKARKTAPDKPDAQERKKRKSKYPKAEEFRDNPLALALNAFADAKGGVPPGTAARCQLGESWLAVLDYYVGGAVDHPIAVAVVSTGSFAAVCYAVGQHRKQGNARPGPASPAGPAKPGVHELDAQCVHCGEVFPSIELVAEHVASKHSEASV